MIPRRRARSTRAPNNLSSISALSSLLPPFSLILACLAPLATATATGYQRPPETNGQVVTSYIPVTTAHPSASGCGEQFWSYVSNTMAAWDPGYGISVDLARTGCLPRAVTSWWDAERLGENSLTTVSLGPITCPQAYFTASTSVKDASSTFVGCCPS